MDDKEIVDLYWARSEEAISETAKKYGRYCHYIAYNILYNDEDSEECVSDTYMKTWKTIPSNRPRMLSTYIGKIVRNSALDKFEHYNARKRGGGQVDMALDELAECIPSGDMVESLADEMTIAEILNEFLASLTPENRKIFMRRYWYLSTVKEIATDFEIGESKVKMSLLRSRSKLKKILEREGEM